MNQTTYSPKPKDITRHWHLFDAKDQTLGRLASEIAKKLIGKDKLYFTGHLDCGDYVVVTNASQIKVTGNKLKDKIYSRHSGFPGGLKQIALGKQLSLDPIKVIEWAVKGMLPKNKLRDPRLRRLKVYRDDSHPYAQQLKSKDQTAK